MLGMLARKYSQADATDLGIEKAASYSRSVAQGRLNALRVDSFTNVYGITNLNWCTTIVEAPYIETGQILTVVYFTYFRDPDGSLHQAKHCNQHGTS